MDTCTGTRPQVRVQRHTYTYGYKFMSARPWVLVPRNEYSAVAENGTTGYMYDYGYKVMGMGTDTSSLERGEEYRYGYRGGGENRTVSTST